MANKKVSAAMDSGAVKGTFITRDRYKRPMPNRASSATNAQ